MDVSTLVKSLEGVSLFSRLSRRSLKKLARLCVARSFAEGEFLVHENDVGLGLYVLTSGRVRVIKGQGEGEIELGQAGAGAIIGEMALIDDQLRVASVVAMEVTDTLLLSRQSFGDLARKDPEIAWCIVPALSQRVRDLDQRQLEMRREQSEAKAAELAEKPHHERVAAQERQTTLPRRTAPRAEPVLQLFRLQCALGMGAVEGLAGMIRVSRNFLSTLARETDLNRSRQLREVLARLPSGMATATRESMREVEELPKATAKRIQRFLEES